MNLTTQEIATMQQELAALKKEKADRTAQEQLQQFHQKRQTEREQILRTLLPYDQNLQKMIWAEQDKQKK